MPIFPLSPYEKTCINPSLYPLYSIAVILFIITCTLPQTNLELSLVCIYTKQIQPREREREREGGREGEREGEGGREGEREGEGGRGRERNALVINDIHYAVLTG